MNMLHALCCLLLVVTVALSQRPVQGANALIGTWRVVEVADLDKDGKWPSPLTPPMSHTLAPTP